MNTADSNAFQEGQREITDKLLHRHFMAGAGIALFIVCMELALFFGEYGGEVLQGSRTDALCRCVVLPACLNLIAVLAVLAVGRGTKSRRLTAYAVTLMYTVFAFALYTVHARFPSLYIVFAIAILLTVPYGDVLMTSIVTAASALCKILSDMWLAGVVCPDSVRDGYARLEQQDFAVSLVGLALFYLACLMMIAAEQQKNELSIRRERENIQLFQKTLTDTLTGVHNRNALRFSIDRVLEDTSDTDYILAMLDIDYFKSVNDTFGHLVGDSFLQQLGKTLMQVPDAEAFRFGGDEFCLLFTGCTREQAAERCRAVQEAFLHNELCKKYIKVNVSFGLAHCEKEKLPPAEWIHCADQALYEAKKNRGSICFYSGEMRGAGDGQKNGEKPADR